MTPQPEMPIDDIDVTLFAEMLQYLEPHPPVTEELHCWRKPYQSEKAHMTGWFICQTGTNGNGAYHRDKGNSSARTTYNRLLAPGAMLWIAEVFGEERRRLEEAVNAAKEAEKIHWRKRCNGFRSVISFDRILELMDNPDGWLIDERLRPYLDRNEDGYPEERDSKAIDKILNEELM